MAQPAHRALPPAQAPPPFDPPVFLQAKRVTGSVGSTAPAAVESEAGSADNDKPCAAAAAAAVVTGNILVVQDGPDKKAFWLQRKIGVTRHHGTVRVGYVLNDGAEEGAWELLSEPPEMVAIITDSKSKVLPGTGNEADNENTGGIDPAAEFSALQLVATHDPEGTGHVLGSTLIAADHQQVYAVTEHHRQGSLFEFCAAAGRLSEPEARFFFRQILKGLQTLQSIELCHRNLSLETVLLAGSTCTLAGLGSALRIPTASGIVHLLETQPPGGSNPQYMAPELLQNKSFDGYSVDLFAAGVMLFCMLLGSDALFVAPVQEDRRFVEICVEGNLKEALQRWEERTSTTDPATPASDDVIDLLQKMLRAEPKDRWTLSQVLEHAWVNHGGEDGATAPTSLVQPTVNLGGSS